VIFEQILDVLYAVGAILVMLMIFLSMIRALAGPTAPDRVVAINIITTYTLIIITLIARIYEQVYFLDIAMVYALMGFITTIGVAKYLEKGLIMAVIWQQLSAPDVAMVEAALGTGVTTLLLIATISKTKRTE